MVKPASKMFPDLGELTNQVLCQSSSGHSSNKMLVQRHFTHSVQIILPEKATVPVVFRNIVEPYYLIRQVRLVEILNFDFLSTFVIKGELSVITAYSPEKKNSMSIGSDGLLTLSLSPEVYFKLGLDGKDVNHLPRKREYNPELKKIEINLKSPNFRPGTKLFDRVLKGVERCGLIYDILLHWSPHLSSISALSPVKFLADKIKDLEWKQCVCRFNYKRMFNVPVPSMFDERFFEWAGVVSAGGTLNINDHTSVQRDLMVAHWTGFIPGVSLQLLATTLRSFALESPFTILTSVGFQSDPTRKTSAAFNNESTLSICFMNNRVECSMFLCPPPPSE